MLDGAGDVCSSRCIEAINAENNTRITHTMKTRIKLTKDLRGALKTRTMKPVDLITWLVNDNGFKSNMPLNEASLSALTLEGQSVTKAAFDTFTNEVELTLK